MAMLYGRPSRAVYDWPFRRAVFPPLFGLPPSRGKDVGKFHIDQRDYNMKNIILKVPISLKLLLLALTGY